jgi:hypothetical protein
MQPELHPDESVLQQPLLPLDISVLQQPVRHWTRLVWSTEPIMLLHLSVLQF